MKEYILRLTPEEIRDTRMVYYAYHTDFAVEVQRNLDTLRSLGINLTVIDAPEVMLGAHDFNFIMQPHMKNEFSGHELLVPAMAALRGVAVLGPPAPIRAISEDKVLGKTFAAGLGVEVAKHKVISPKEPGISNTYPGGRWVLKPRSGVLSEGVMLVLDASGWRSATGRAMHPMHGGQDYLAEEFVPGLNIAVPVIEGFPPKTFSAFLERGESTHNILTQSGKEGRTPDYGIQPYNGPGAAEAQATAAKLADALRPMDYARFDFRFEPVSNRLVFLEVNINCASGPLSVVGRAAQLHGIEHPTLLGHVIAHSLRRQRKAK